MIRLEVNLENSEVVKRAMDKFMKDAQTRGKPIIRTASEILYMEARRRVPVSKSGKKKGKWAHPPGTLRDSIEIGDVWTTPRGIFGAVGIKQNRYFTQAPHNIWYARWVEFGTKERIVKNWYGRKGVRHTAGAMLAQPFMRPALVKSRAKIRNTVRYRLQEELFRNDGDNT